MTQGGRGRFLPPRAGSRMSCSGEVSLKAVVFDLGGVILDVRADKCFRHWSKVVGTDADRLRRRFKADCQEPFERGDISPETFHERVSIKLGRSISYDDLLTGWNSVFCGVLPKVGELLSELSGLTRLAVLSNTNVLHAQFFRRRYGEAFVHFERVFLSHEIGTRKPEPECYQFALNQLCLRAEETVFIDDTSGNIAAARRLGMHGVEAASTGQIRQELRALGMDLSR